MQAGTALAKQRQTAQQDDAGLGFSGAQDAGAAQVVIAKALGHKATEQALDDAVL